MRMRLVAPLFFSVTLAMLLICLPAFSRGTAPNAVVVPPYRAQIRAAHRVHAEQAKLSCKDCHEQATSSRCSADWLGPKPEVCARCHGPKHEQLTTETPLGADCRRCHLSAPGTTRPAARLAFSHAKHDQRGIDCAKCHPAVARLEDAQGSERLPKQSTCSTCHRAHGRSEAEPPATCIRCHESERGRIRTRFGDQRLTPSGPGVEHGPDVRRTHGAYAANQPRRCQACHDERQCQRCHDGRLRPRDIHPSNWITAHGIASKQGNDCSRCHRAQSFCLDCHRRVGVTASGPASQVARRGAMHPPASVWINGSRGPKHHAVAARRNLAECVSCHQERDCVRCHAASGLGSTGLSRSYGKSTKPHGSGFAASCSKVFARNPRPCLTCHRPEGSEIQRCR